MRSETRLFKFFENFLITFKEKFFFFQNSFSSSIFFLFFGFLFGNLFGTLLNGIRAFVYWDGFIVLSLIFFIEIISYITYHKEGRSFFFIWRFCASHTSAKPFYYQRRLFWKSFNFLKIGLMLGFFIDAFKVGS
jgi:hypothetical protein